MSFLAAMTLARACGPKRQRRRGEDDGGGGDDGGGKIVKNGRGRNSIIESAQARRHFVTQKGLVSATTLYQSGKRERNGKLNIIFKIKIHRIGSVSANRDCQPHVPCLSGVLCFCDVNVRFW